MSQKHYKGTNPNPLQGHYHILADCDTIEVAHPLIESACQPTFTPGRTATGGLPLLYIASHRLFLWTGESTRLNLKSAAYWLALA